MSLRAVLDTNVLVSAIILPAGRVGAIIRHLRQGGFVPVYSMETLQELASVLARPRIKEKYRITGSDVRTIIDLIILRGDIVEPVEPVTACRDPKDDIFLSVAIAGHVDLIVTGDEDLLSLNPFRGVPIVSPARFLAMIEAPQ